MPTISIDLKFDIGDKVYIGCSKEDGLFKYGEKSFKINDLRIWYNLSLDNNPQVGNIYCSLEDCDTHKISMKYFNIEYLFKELSDATICYERHKREDEKWQAIKT